MMQGESIRVYGGASIDAVKEFVPKARSGSALVAFSYRFKCSGLVRIDLFSFQTTWIE